MVRLILDGVASDNVQSGPNDRTGSGTSTVLTSALTKWRPFASGHFACGSPEKKENSTNNNGPSQ